MPENGAHKENFMQVDADDVLERLAALEIQTWNYKKDDPSIRHIGPMAQDFVAAFGVGEDDKHIHQVDAVGVTFASIQALHKRIQVQEHHVNHLRTTLEEMKRELTRNQAPV